MIYAALAAYQLASGYFASQNIKETAKLNKKISDMNAEFAELDAYDAEIQGHTDQAKYQSTIDNTLADQQAQLTAKDVDVTYGSAASIRTETSFRGRLNLMEIQKQANQKALGYRQQARNIRLTGKADYRAAQGQATQALVSGATSAAKTSISGYGRNYTPDSADRAGGNTSYSDDYLNS